VTKAPTLLIPEMTMDQYAEAIGVTERTVEEWVKSGKLPSIKIGKRRLVNVAQRFNELATQEEMFSHDA